MKFAENILLEICRRLGENKFMGGEIKKVKEAINVPDWRVIQDKWALLYITVSKNTRKGTEG